MIRLFPLALGFSALLFAAPAFAQAPAPPATATATTADAETLFRDRKALLAIDARCSLLPAEARAALEASTAQAGGALLRRGWTATRLERTAEDARRISAAQPCTAAPVREAVARAAAAYEAWARLPFIQFPGDVRAWTARRTPDGQGWYLRQDMGGGLVFGLRQEEEGPRAAFAAPLTATSPLPAYAALEIREIARASMSMAEMPGRSGPDLSRRAPPPGMRQVVFASERRIETDDDGRRVVVFLFPDEVLAAVAALDPREAAALRVGAELSAPPVRVYVEAGDLGAAQAFLAARPTAPPPRPPPTRPRPGA